MNVRRLHLCSILAASLLLPALAVHAASDRAFQYQLDLISANGDAYPLVRKIDIQLK